MSVISNIGARLRILNAKLQGDPFLKYSTWKDVMHELFKPYGRHRGRFIRGIKRRMHIETEGSMLRVEIDGKIFYWPNGVDRGALPIVYFEVYNEKNNHYYDITGMEIKKGDIVLDVGACEGYFTRKALDSGAEKVYCIEPGSAVFNCLEKTFADEIISRRVSLFSYLMGDRNEIVRFYEDPTLPQTAGLTYNVKDKKDKILLESDKAMLTIDELCARHSIPKIDFIKADVEGSEIELICGAERSIRKFKPRIAIAVYHKPENANRIARFVEGLSAGYTIRVKGIIDIDKVPRPVMVHCYQK